jgi:excisionase family DNA binding protein
MGERLETMSQQPERLAYKVREVANMLGVSPRRVYELVRSKQIPSFKLGGTGDMLIPANDLEETINRWKEQAQ